MDQVGVEDPAPTEEEDEEDDEGENAQAGKKCFVKHSFKKKSSCSFHLPSKF